VILVARPTIRIAVPGFTPGRLVSVLGLSSVAIGFAFRDILQNFLAGSRNSSLLRRRSDPGCCALRWWVHPPRHFELQRGLDTVLAKVRQAMLAESAEALHRRSRSKRRAGEGYRM